MALGMQLGKLMNNVKQSAKLKRINSAINRQLNQCGKTLLRNISRALLPMVYALLINRQFPKAIRKEIEDYFVSGGCRFHPDR
jgi:hypothetical protein